MGLDGERFGVVSFFNNGEDLVGEPTLVPIKDRVKEIFSPDLDISRLLSILYNILIIHVPNLLSFSIQVKLNLFILNGRMINGGKIFTFGHSSLFGEKIQFSLLFVLIVLEI